MRFPATPQMDSRSLRADRRFPDNQQARIDDEMVTEPAVAAGWRCCRNRSEHICRYRCDCRRAFDTLVGVIEKLGNAVVGYQEGQRVIAGAICPTQSWYARRGRVAGRSDRQRMLRFPLPEARRHDEAHQLLLVGQAVFACASASTGNVLDHIAEAPARCGLEMRNRTVRWRLIAASPATRPPVLRSMELKLGTNGAGDHPLSS